MSVLCNIRLLISASRYYEKTRGYHSSVKFLICIYPERERNGWTHHLYSRGSSSEKHKIIRKRKIAGLTQLMTEKIPSNRNFKTETSKFNSSVEIIVSFKLLSDFGCCIRNSDSVREVNFTLRPHSIHYLFYCREIAPNDRGLVFIPTMRGISIYWISKWTISIEILVTNFTLSRW